MNKRLAWAGTAILSVYLVFIGGGWYGIYLPSLRLTSVVLAGLGLAIWAAASAHNPNVRPRSSLMPAIGACLGSLAISTIFSRVPGISLEYLGYAIVLASLYLLLVQLLRDDFFRRRFVLLARVLFVAVVVAYAALVLSHWAQWWTALGRVTIPPLRPDYESLTFGNPSAVLTVVALLAVPVVASLAWTDRRGVIVGSVVLSAVAVVALFTGSRAGWLALALTAALCITVVLLNAAARKRLRQLAGRALNMRFPRMVLAAGALAAIALAVVLVPVIVRRAGEGGEASRTTYVQVALRLFSTSPIVGTGPGTWVIERPAFSAPGDVIDYVPHAHDVYVQTLAELGAVGVVAGLVLTFMLARLIAGAMLHEDRVQHPWAWATLFGLAYFAAHQLLDFYANLPAVLFLAALPVAYLDATADPPIERRSLLTRFGRFRLRSALAIPVVAIAVGGLSLQELPALQAQAVVDRANEGDWASETEARDAAAADARISPYLFTAGLLAARHGDHALAIDYFESVAQRDDLPEAWLDLAAEQLLAGNRQSVERSIRAALELGSQRSSITVPAGELALRAGYRDLGIDVLVTAVTEVPPFLADPWWDTNPTVAGLRTQIANRAAAASPVRAWEIYLMIGDAAQAHTLAAPGATMQADFIDGWMGDGAAASRLLSSCEENPFNVEALGWCARVANRMGNSALADRFRYLAGTQNEGGAFLGTDVRAVDATNLETVDTNLALFWAPFTYRRFTPWDMLVPSLVHLTLA